MSYDWADEKAGHIASLCRDTTDWPDTIRRIAIDLRTAHSRGVEEAVPIEKIVDIMEGLHGLQEPTVATWDELKAQLGLAAAPAKEGE